MTSVNTDHDVEKVAAWFVRGGRIMVLNEDGTDRELVDGSAKLVEVLGANLATAEPQGLGLRFVR